jgi:bifunctional ADP-heptose synthase (sugar kinase/adenylyltransferase)
VASAEGMSAARRRTPGARDLVATIRRFPRVRLLVVGDLMLDQFIHGSVTRISPEAPVPVVQVTGESFHLGGAANVAANIRALGGQTAVVGVVGNDASGARLTRDLRSIGVGVSGIAASRTRRSARFAFSPTSSRWSGSIESRGRSTSA